MGPDGHNTARKAKREETHSCVLLVIMRIRGGVFTAWPECARTIRRWLQCARIGLLLDRGWRVRGRGALTLWLLRLQLQIRDLPPEYSEDETKSTPDRTLYASVGIRHSCDLDQLSDMGRDMIVKFWFQPWAYLIQI